ncbi:alpha/beta hydrolase [Carbonactinospora thermoautotrophica]|uniref:alpha/beta hydrolase n=1 Tax=Carbonactinospora thermoautotrophica TaxID=1469144 RepID=UPI0011464473|nr:alpha/beta hydrolase [Carbonactinospora thermoautotrophica]
MTFRELREIRPEAFETAAASWRALVQAVRAHATGLGRHTGSLAGAWEGPAYQAATAHLAGQQRDLAGDADRMAEVAEILTAHAARLAEAKAELQAALHLAEGLPLRVGEDGSVTYLPTFGTADAAVLAERAQRVAAGIQAAVALAQAADAETSARLAACLPAAVAVAVPQSAVLVRRDQVPAQGTDPRQVKAWWDSLTPEQRRYVIDHYPELVGGLDGIPCLVRDEANRAVLAREKQRLEQRRRDLEAKGATRSDAENAELADINDKLKGVYKIEERLNATRPDLPPAYLLGFDTEGRGHAIVAVGNPDTADNVVTYVPGTNGRLGKIGNDIPRADAMVRAARDADPSKTTAAIVWLDYDAPQAVVNPKDPGEDATNPKHALNARDSLDRFQDGLRVTHEGPRSHNTVLGHSYGSTVVGFTARDRGLNADDVIFVGSPGVGVDRAAGLGISPQHVWSSTAKNDPIQYSPSKDPLEWFDGRDDLIHGANPSSPEFGGRVFESDPGTPLVEWDWRGLGEPSPSKINPEGAHSEYWEQNSTSLKNIGRIVAGKEPSRPGDERPAEQPQEGVDW